MNITVDGTICYIQQFVPGRNKLPEFRLICAPITSIRIGKKSVKAYSEQFRPLDVEELEFNTKFLLESTNMILVQEPFLDVNGLKERARIWVESRGWEIQ